MRNKIATLFSPFLEELKDNRAGGLKKMIYLIVFTSLRKEFCHSNIKRTTFEIWHQSSTQAVLRFLRFFTRVTWGRSPQHRYIIIVQTTTTSSVILYLLPLDLFLLWPRFLFLYLLFFSLLFCCYCFFSFSFCCSTTTSVFVLFPFSSNLSDSISLFLLFYL